MLDIEYTTRSLTLAVIASLKKAQELTFLYCGSLVEKEKHWFEVPFWGGVDKAIVKSIWRHYIGKI